MNTVYINTTDSKTIADVHRQLQEKLVLPDYYGSNANALWDCITGWVELPINLVWAGYGAAEARMGAPVAELRTLLLEAENEVDGFSVEFVS